MTVAAFFVVGNYKIYTLCASHDERCQPIASAFFAVYLPIMPPKTFARR